MEILILVFISVALIAVVIKVTLAKKSSNREFDHKPPTDSPILHKKRDFLCTENEKKLFYALQTALNNQYLVHCQTSLIALVGPVEFKNKSKAWSKRVDFVITDKTTKVLAVIELDDSTHKQKKRIARDKYVNEALAPHHPLIRVPTKNFYEPKNILSMIQEKANISI